MRIRIRLLIMILSFKLDLITDITLYLFQHSRCYPSVRSYSTYYGVGGLILLNWSKNGGGF